MKNSTSVWYYRTYGPEGKRTIGRSTGETNKTKARQHCKNLIDKGKLVPSSAPTLSDWAISRNWWVWGECLYIRGRLERSDPRKPAISRRYADDTLRSLKTHILPDHGAKRLDSITANELETLQFSWLDQGATHKTINNWASIYRVMLSEAQRLGMIDVNPWDRVPAFTSASKSRGALTVKEAFRLLDPSTLKSVWREHHLYYVINLAAAVTAMRQGELLALQSQHVIEGNDRLPPRLCVESSWHIRYKKGPTKTKIQTEIPIPQFLYDQMTKYLEWGGFVFSFDNGDRPCTGNRVTEWLYGAMRNIGISEQERIERNITFHSWRKFANTYWRGRGVPDPEIRAVTGHKSPSMTERYTTFQLEDMERVIAAQTAMIKQIIQAPT